MSPFVQGGTTGGWAQAGGGGESSPTRKSPELLNPYLEANSHMQGLDQTIEQLIRLASDHFKVPAAELKPDDDFFKKLGINSFQALDLLTKLEDHFKVELP